MRPAFLAVVLVLVASGCGGDGAQGGLGGWVDDVCEAGLRWQEDLSRRSEDLQDQMDTADDPEQARDRLATYYEGAEERTESLLDDLREAGAAPVERGADIADDLEDGYARIGALFGEGAEETRALPVDDGDAFSRAARDVQTSLARRAADVNDAFRRIDQYGNEELDRAFAQNPDCREFAGRADVVSVRSTAKAMLTVVRYMVIRSPSTSQLMLTTSAPVMPRIVFAASATATCAAWAKLSGELPMMVTTLATSLM